jgi:hypothetical protein
MSSTILVRIYAREPAPNVGQIAVRCLFALGCALTPVHGALADSLSVTEWFLSCSANGPGSSDDPYAFFDTVQSPFVGEHSVSLTSSPCTTASAQYLIEYTSHSASFNISAQQTARALATSMVSTSNTAYIWLTSTEPMPLHIDASWTYSLPVDFMMASLLVTVVDPQREVTLFAEAQDAGTFPGEPAFGTLSIEGDVTLPPGPTWVLRYGLDLYASEGTQAYAATGDGHVNFTITPEPASLMLLAPVLLALRRPAVRRERAPSA